MTTKTEEKTKYTHTHELCRNLIRRPDGSVLAILPYSEEFGREAALIVKAVNNYASLRSQNETLRRDNEAMARCLESMKDAGFSFSLAVNAAIANALATLEEKS